jgi:Protein of unknown function (DUF742)
MTTEHHPGDGGDVPGTGEPPPFHRPATPVDVAAGPGRLLRPFLADVPPGPRPAAPELAGVAAPPRPVAPAPGPPASATGGTGESWSEGTPPTGTHQASVRPFLLTQGRTVGATEIAVETQVAATPLGETAVETLTFEYRDIVTLCLEPLAVAEIAARLGLHLGVVRVLVGDLHHQGMVATYEPEVALIDDVDTIERVINVLRART